MIYPLIGGFFFFFFLKFDVLNTQKCSQKRTFLLNFFCLLENFFSFARPYSYYNHIVQIGVVGLIDRKIYKMFNI